MGYPGTGYSRFENRLRSDSEELILLLINETVQGITGFFVALGENMGVNVQCRADFGMTKPLGYREAIDTFGNQKAGLGVPEFVWMDRREVMPLGKLSQPIRRAVRVHGLAVLRRQYVVRRSSSQELVELRLFSLPPF